MKKWLSMFLVLVTASAASASLVEIRPIPEGEPGSASNPLWSSDEVVVLVYTDTPLVGLDAILTLDGPATIVGALDEATAASYGWDPRFTYDPIVPGAAVEICGGNFDGAPGPIVGWFRVRCEDYGEVTATVLGATVYGGSMDINYETPEITGSITIYQLPEPMTIGLLGLGVVVVLRRRR
ncbi:MAG: PEP-CTERM sorting domain-containing protein [Planctomycetota bacterium]|jgi:hypothetical protein